MAQFFDPVDTLISLSEIIENSKLPNPAIRDAQIYCVGKIPSRGMRRIVPCSTPAHCEQANANDDIVAIVAPENLTEYVSKQKGFIVSDKPLETAYKIHEYLCDLDGHYWKNFDTIIAPTAQIHPSAIIPSQNVIIGDGTIIEAGCVIRERTIIGEKCKIGPAVVIGGDAFEITKIDNEQKVLKQAGGVQIGNNVVILASSHIARATFIGFTKLDDYAAIDAQVHIAHDCHIQKHVKITACSEVSGRVVIGEGAYLGPNCTISNGLNIGKGAKITIGSVVIKDVADNQTVSGNFAIDHKKWLRFIRNIARKR